MSHLSASRQSRPECSDVYMPYDLGCGFNYLNYDHGRGELVSRRDTQQAHERAQVAAFLAWFNKRYRSDFQVIAEPNPPEAIIKSGRTMRWIEVTDAFWNNEYAIDEYSYATLGERHRPMGKGPHLNPDATFAERFVEVIRKKLEKPSYLPSQTLYGPGYLLVPINYPLFTRVTLDYMREAWAAATINDLGCFRAIYTTNPISSIYVQRWTEYP